MPQTFVLPRQVALDEDADPLSGALLYFYSTGTTTPQAVYADVDLTTPHTNPVVADSAGNFPKIYLDSDAPANYRVRLTTASGVLRYQEDDIEQLSLTTEEIAELLYPQSEIEDSLGIDPPNKQYEYNNVLRFGADPTGVADSTTAFDQANLVGGNGRAGQRVFVPAGTYKVANIEVVNGMHIEGESHGEGANAGDATVLEVSTNGAGAFRHSTSTDKFWVTLKNLHIRAASGVTNARAYLQSDKEFYTVHLYCEGVSTSRNLVVGYEGFFLLADWVHCWDGYSGTPPGSQDHQFITSHPASYSQIRTTNLCRVHRCSVFGGTSGAAAMIDVSLGAKWDIDGGTQLEDMDCPAIRMRGVMGGTISCWFENIRASRVAIFDNDPDAIQGCGNWAIRDTWMAMYGFTGSEYFEFTVDAACNVTFDGVQLTQVATGDLLVSGTVSVVGARNVRAFSGSGASDCINIPVDSSGSFEMESTGLTTTEEVTVSYILNGRSVTLFVPNVTGTSNATSFTITGIPSPLRPTQQQGNLLISVQDNGVRAVGIARPETTGVISFFPSLTSTSWTNSGTKTASAFNVTYPIT